MLLCIWKVSRYGASPWIEISRFPFVENQGKNEKVRVQSYYTPVLPVDLTGIRVKVGTERCEEEVYIYIISTPPPFYRVPMIYTSCTLIYLWHF